jgi:hypothetical protein
MDEKSLAVLAQFPCKWAARINASQTTVFEKYRPTMLLEGALSLQLKRDDEGALALKVLVDFRSLQTFDSSRNDMGNLNIPRTPNPKIARKSLSDLYTINFKNELGEQQLPSGEIVHVTKGASHAHRYISFAKSSVDSERPWSPSSNIDSV